MHDCISDAADARLATAEGHIKAIRKMIAENRGCEDVLLQLSAVEASLHSLGKTILKDHLNHCVKEGLEQGDVDILSRFSKVLDKYL